MPRQNSGVLWSCWERSRARGRKEQDGKPEEKEILGALITREVEEEPGRVQSWMRLHWTNWPKWSHCVVSIAVMWLVLLDESPLHPSVSLTEGWARLLLTVLLCAATWLYVTAFCFLHSYKQKPKQVLPHNGNYIVRKSAGNQKTCITGQQDAGHLVAKVNVLADGLVVSLLHEPLPDSSEPHIRDLLTRLEAVSQALHKGVKDDEQEKCAIKCRVNHINSYLLDRVSSLRSLLRVQRETDVSVCEVQRALQKHWALLETLHTRVTLKPNSKQEVNDPHAVLTDTENLFNEIGQFKSKIQQCRTQLETSMQLLQALCSSQQGLSEAVGSPTESTWTKQLLQSNTDLFSEIHEDFTSLEQQTSNFVIHLRGLKASEEKTSLADTQASPRLSLPAVPVYTAVSQAAHSDPDSDPESSEPSQKPHSKPSPFHLLCGMKRRRSSP